MTPAFRLSLAVAFVTGLAATAAAQIAPPRDLRPGAQAPQPTGTGTISGVVLMAGSGQPARKVRVSLGGAEVRGRTATTDDQGRFSFTALPAGRYSLSATRPGHVNVTYGQRRPGRPGTPIQLADGQKFQADLQIPKSSVITGTVLDEHGEPSPQIPVRVMRVVLQNGERTLQGSNSGSTDDRGIYRIFGLLPGEYVVCATPRNTNLADVGRMREELQEMELALELAARNNPEGVGALRERISALQMSAPPPDQRPSGYAPICYPGSISATTAAPVPLGIAEERMGIDFNLQLAPLARVEGSVINSTGVQVREMNVTLSDINPLGQSLPNINARADGEGRFQLQNVPPGQYRVSARATLAPPRAPANVEAAAAPGGRGGPPQGRQEPIVVWAAADVSVDGRDVQNLMLTLQNGISVSGQVAFEGATPPPPDLTRLRVSMTPVGRNPFGGSVSGRVDANGRFTIVGVPPGRYRLSGGGGSGWFVDSAVAGGQDALDLPLEVKGTQNIGSAVITFTDRQTELTGIMTDDRSQPAVDYSLVVFAADSRFWTPNSRRVQSTRPATDGRFTLRNLPPGEYRIAPVVDLEPGATTDPAFLQGLESSALSVTLQPGEKKTQDIRLGSR